MEHKETYIVTFILSTVLSTALMQRSYSWQEAGGSMPAQLSHCAIAKCAYLASHR